MFVIGKSFSQIKVAIEKVSDSGKRFRVSSLYSYNIALIAYPCTLFFS